MITSTLTHVADAVRHDAIPLAGGPQDFDPLLQKIGDARFVLIGEASHGTHDFYRVRAELTKRLIREKGFHAVAVEADWPDAYRVNRYVRGTPDDPDANDALGSFRRFPTWMWRNADVLDFVGWLRSHNEALPRFAPKVGFYGLDLYSLYTSIEEVLRFLDRVDPAAAARARERYACFERFEDPEAYGYATGPGHRPSCEAEAVAQLVELHRRRAKYSQQDGRIPEDELFYAEQNARLIRNAEMYYRSMFGGRVSSWNLRDQHMAETLEELAAHLDRRVQRSKFVVWEHNSHLGDARATELGAAGEWNVGQLVRAHYPAETFLIGFTTYSGTVTAASAWGGSAERKTVRPALEGSVEALFHDLALRNFLLLLKDGSAAADALHEEMLERAIGVIYLPETERQSHYFHARLAQQFDAVLHYDQTRAVEPLERTALWQRGDLPETYPIGL